MFDLSKSSFFVAVRGLFARQTVDSDFYEFLQFFRSIWKLRLILLVGSVAGAIVGYLTLLSIAPPNKLESRFSTGFLLPTTEAINALKVSYINLFLSDIQIAQPLLNRFYTSSSFSSYIDKDRQIAMIRDDLSRQLGACGLKSKVFFLKNDTPKLSFIVQHDLPITIDDVKSFMSFINRSAARFAENCKSASQHAVDRRPKKLSGVVYDGCLLDQLSVKEIEIGQLNRTQKANVVRLTSMGMLVGLIVSYVFGLVLLLIRSYPVAAGNDQ